MQTIHAFAERLLQRFPLEAGVPPDFKILDEDAASDLKAQAIERTLIEATAAPSTPLGKALDVVVRYAADAQFDTLISNAVDERRWLEAINGQALGKTEDAFARNRELSATKPQGSRGGLPVRTFIANAPASYPKTTYAKFAQLSRPAPRPIKSTPELLASPRSTLDAPALRRHFGRVLPGRQRRGEAQQPDDQRPSGRRGPICSTGASRLSRDFFALSQELKALMLIEASVALYRLAGAVLQRYTDARKRGGRARLR